MDVEMTRTRPDRATALRPASQVYDSVLQAFGRTPLVRLNRVTREVGAAVFAKLEFLNPGGSVKDRVGLSIIEDAEASGRLKPGSTIVEATSGNTGVGLAITAAIKGYRCVFVMPDKMSDEKIRMLRAFGARVVLTPTAVAPDDPRSYYKVADRIVAETPGAILANQYHNPANPAIHYETTGPEIWEQTEGRVDIFVAGMGTGGTISGVGRYLKEQNPDVKVIGADPVGSILHELFQTGKMGEAHTYKIEGIGEDFKPSTLDFSMIDDTVQVTDRDSFLVTRQLVRHEGIFCGGSSGSALAGALQYLRAHNVGPDKTVVVLLPDSGSRYLSKLFNDDWMQENGFLTSPWAEMRVADVLESKATQTVYTARSTDRMTDVIALMKKHDISQVPVVENGGRLAGIVTEVELLDHLLSDVHEHHATETVASMVNPDVTTVSLDTPLEMLKGAFEAGGVAVVIEGEQVTGILTKIDLLHFMSTQLA